MVYFKENCNFPRFQRGSIIFFQGEGPNFLQGGGGGGIAYSLYPYQFLNNHALSMSFILFQVGISNLVCGCI